MTTDELLDEIVSTIRKFLGDQVDIIVLFGSMATGETHPLSDIDIGVKVSLKEEDYSYIFTELLSLFDSSKNPHIDVTLLNMASLSLQFRVVRDGKILYVRENEKNDLWETYVEYVLTRYPDWSVYIENYLKQSIGV